MRLVAALVYGGLIRAVSMYLRLGDPAASVNLRGSFAAREQVYGLSDIDVIVIVPCDSAQPGERRDRMAARWQRLVRFAPFLVGPFEVSVFEDVELNEACARPPILAGLEVRAAGEPPPTLLFGPSRVGNPPQRAGGVGFFGPLRRLRTIAGPNRVSGLPDSREEDRWLWAWLDVQFRWKHAMWGCANPGTEQAAYFAMKMISDSVKGWLWLTQRELVSRRSDLLERALELLPDEEEAIRIAITLRRALHRKPRAPLETALPFLFRMAQRIARLIAEEADRHPRVVVRLLRNGDDLLLPSDAGEAARRLLPQPGELRLLPLADFRARVLPGLPDEAFVPVPGDPADPATLGRAASAGNASPFPALVSGDLLVLATTTRGTQPLTGGALRAIQTPVTDPVSFAVLAGKGVAEFSALTGWSPSDTARLEVAEHRAWFAYERVSEPGARIGGLLSAARAALFLESVEKRRPELALTAATVADRLTEVSGVRTAVHDALERYRCWRVDDASLPPRTADALERVVRQLPAYSGPVVSPS